MSNYKNILRTNNYIAGAWAKSGQGELTVSDKYTGDDLARVPLASKKQMESAIVAAHKGLAALRAWSAGERSAALERTADLLEADREAFVDLIVREAGKPLGYARGEVDRCLITLRTAAAEAVRFGGEAVPIDFAAGKGKTAFTKRFPVGVVACITPFNFPLNLVLHKVAPALAVGCPVIVKPAPQAPLSALALAALVEEAGFPKGAYQAAVCDIPVAELLVTDPRIAMLSFTGSDKVGWHLKSICGKKKLTLELGGNAAVIVDASSDLAAAAKSVALGAFLYAGQVCISTQRIFVVRSVYKEFERLLLEEVKALKAGDPHDPAVTVGPIIDKGHAERIKSWVDEAVKEGARVLTGGKPLDPRRNIYAPTLLTGTGPDMKVNREEAFGPVAVLESVESFDEAVRQVNDSPFGLQAGVFTNAFDHVKKAHDELEVGGIIINGVPGFRVDSMPYGGIKNSGLGREGIRYAMEEMTEPRLIVY